MSNSKFSQRPRVQPTPAICKFVPPLGPQAIQLASITLYLELLYQWQPLPPLVFTNSITLRHFVTPWADIFTQGTDAPPYVIQSDWIDLQDGKGWRLLTVIGSPYGITTCDPIYLPTWTYLTPDSQWLIGNAHPTRPTLYKARLFL